MEISEDLEILKQKNERLKAALSFYANTQVWSGLVQFDRGEIARTAISQCDNDKAGCEIIELIDGGKQIRKGVA